MWHRQKRIKIKRKGKKRCHCLWDSYKSRNNLILFVVLWDFKKINFNIGTPQVAITKRNWPEKHSFFSVKGFPDFRSSLCAKQSGKFNYTYGVYNEVLNLNIPWEWFIFLLSMSIGAVICSLCLSICRLESDSKGRWTGFSHLQTMETPQRGAHRLIQVMLVIRG